VAVTNFNVANVVAFDVGFIGNGANNVTWFDVIFVAYF